MNLKKIFSLFKSFNFKSIEKNKLFIGVMMIMMNIASRYVELKFTKGQEAMIRNVAREILIFIIAFVATRDLFISLILTAVFIILANFIFNENCKYNIVPKRYKNVINEMDFNNDGKVSDEEIKKAEDILKKAKKQTKLTNKINMLNYM
tara:strand:- start:2080 stop:2526 length:447 start_codon:yes stop_codon:yes gene_type:complete